MPNLKDQPMPPVDDSAPPSPMSDNEVNMDEMASDEEPETEDSQPPPIPEDDALGSGPKSPEHPAVEPDSQPVVPTDEDPDLWADSQPASPLVPLTQPSPQQSPKGIEPIVSEKCVLIEDTPEKAPLSEQELKEKVREVEQALLNAKKLRTAKIFVQHIATCLNNLYFKACVNIQS